MSPYWIRLFAVVFQLSTIITLAGCKDACPPRPDNIVKSVPIVDTCAQLTNYRLVPGRTYTIRAVPGKACTCHVLTKDQKIQNVLASQLGNKDCIGLDGKEMHAGDDALYIHWIHRTCGQTCYPIDVQLSLPDDIGSVAIYCGLSRDDMALIGKPEESFGPYELLPPLADNMDQPLCSCEMTIPSDTEVTIYTPDPCVQILRLSPTGEVAQQCADESNGGGVYVIKSEANIRIQFLPMVTCGKDNKCKRSYYSVKTDPSNVQVTCRPASPDRNAPACPSCSCTERPVSCRSTKVQPWHKDPAERGLIIGIIIALTIVGFLAGMLAGFFCWKCRRSKPKEHPPATKFEVMETLHDDSILDDDHPTTSVT